MDKFAMLAMIADHVSLYQGLSKGNGNRAAG